MPEPVAVKERIMRHTFKQIVKNIAVTGICIAAAAAVCVLLKITVGAAGFGAVFLLSAAVVSEKTDGYFYGIFAAAAGAALSVALGGFSAGNIAEAAAILSAGVAICLIIGRSKSASELVRDEKRRVGLLRSAAHDIRTPLFSVKLSAGLIKERGDRLSQRERTELLDGISSSVDQLTTMTENILTLTNGKLSELKKSGRLAEEVISEAALSFRRMHDSVAVTTSVLYEPPEIMMDAQLIGQVMRNLLENAARHGEADMIEITLEAANGFAEFRVSDNGKGIPEHALGSLFAESSGNGADDGGARSMGVGLSLCRTIIELHGGTLRGRNTADGAEFAFTLPL